MTVGELIFVTAYGRTISIDPAGLAITLPYLPFDWSPIPPSLGIDRSYRVLPGKNDRIRLSIDGQVPIDIASVQQLGEHIEGDLHHWLATYTQGYLFVHAGCVSWRGRGIVIPGRSHAGKSTLTRALVEAGATYYSDDYAVVDTDGMIWPFPRRLHIRPVDLGPPHRLDPVEHEWPIGKTPMRAALVAELRFDRELGWAVETRSGGLGALSLLDNTVAARERPEDSLRMMTAMIEHALAIKGTRDNAETSARRLLAMVDDMLDGR